MQLSDFKIGEAFYTGSGKWICLDIGTRCIIAVKEESALKRLEEHFIIDNPTLQDVLDRFDIVGGTPFWEMDFGGCRKEDTFTKRSNIV